MPISIPTNLNNFLSCDLAIGDKHTNDWSVILPFGIDYEQDMWCHPDLFRDRVDGLEIVDAILNMAIKYSAQTIFIERGHISMALMPLIRRRMNEKKKYFNFHEHVPTKDKAAYARPLQALLQQGKVHFPDTPLFRDTVCPELLSFPAGKWDDIVSAMSIAALMLDHHIAAAPPPDLPKDPGSPLSYDNLIKPMRDKDKARKDSHRPGQLFGRKK